MNTTPLPALAATTPEHPLDLLIVGAGLSGIDIAHHVAKNFPHWNWAAVDSNYDVGGTWATFQYPGIRSDSDMATFSLPFKKWPHKGTLGSGKQIRDYCHEAAEEIGMLDRLQLSTWVQAADFHTDCGLWEVAMRVGRPGHANSEGTDPASLEQPTITTWTRRLHFATGYYRHSEGFTADIEGVHTFAGTALHPQQWPRDLDVRGKKVTVIGSGATAITLVPALHGMGAEVTMLQRTPTYIAPLPETDTISTLVGLALSTEPGTFGHRLARSLHIGRDMAQYHLCQTFPAIAKLVFRGWNRMYLPADEIRRNFTPPYGPWDQRVCKSPGGDFFKAVRDGARVVTDHISHVDAGGVHLRSGGYIESDVLVIATGLQLLAFGDAHFSVDGTPVPTESLVAYRAMMANRLPNFSYTIGYLNQSWTLRADMTSRYLVQLWKDMDTRGEQWACPVLPDGEAADRPLLEMSSGYIQRSIGSLPRQGAGDPWRMEQDYIKERRTYTGADNTHDMAFGAEALEAAAPLASGTGGGGAAELRV
ncbi:flavin-containing monooxygenase [Corynebacterium sp. YSMAA1_1_F7]|uniref:flavin-containing monooxygenase n=1 Tax=Corynebacterium sp. YSMAA1_1_F7 TaxID=3383590 RepID=UPI0038D1760E